MEDYIIISNLSDFIFCPYSIYLHNVYQCSGEDLIKAEPQMKGDLAHDTIDNNKYSSLKNDLTSLSVCSNKLGIVGKIDIYRGDQKLLVERKYKITTIYTGMIYQLWAQYFCMVEMGYAVEKIALYSLSTNKMYYLNIPTVDDFNTLKIFIKKFMEYEPSDILSVNDNKCRKCIYINLCDKTNTEENVY